MKKVFLFSLIMVLLGALIVPAIAAPAPVSAWSGTVTCDPGELYFRVYEGVPTYLLGFIPLEEGQKLTLTHEGSGIAGWTVSDNAGWLNENLLFGVLSGSGHSHVTVRVNTNGLAAGTYTATITFKFTTCATKTITIPVTVDVIEPKVMGPLGIGIDRIFGEEDEYGGLVTNLLTNPDDAMDMQAIETDGWWNLKLQRGDEIPELGYAPLTGGTFTVNGETIQIMGGGVGGFSMLMSLMGGALPIPADFDWGENYVAMFVGSDGNQYMGLLLADIGKLLDLLPMLGDMLSGEEAAGTSLSAPPSTDSTSGTPTGPVINEPSPEMVIPLKPILNILSPLMPVVMNLLQNETVLSILKPLMGLLPPIMIVMPMDLVMELFSGLM
jgi:hypothetical protein